MPDEHYRRHPDTSGTVMVGGSTMSEIESAGDVDWFAVTLVAGKRYRIDLEGEDTGDGTLADPFLRGIYDSSGTLISSTEDDNRGEDDNSRVYFKADGGRHLLRGGRRRGNRDGHLHAVGGRRRFRGRHRHQGLIDAGCQ